MGKASLLFCILLFAAGCGNQNSVDAEECYYEAEYDHAGQLSEFVDDLIETHLEMTDAHYAGDLLHIPLVDDRSIYFGGLCVQTAHWVSALAPRFTVNEISEDAFDEIYESAKRQSDEQQ